MEKLINQLQQAYPHEIKEIKVAGPAEINIYLNDGAVAEKFSQELQDHLVSTIDELTIIKINVYDSAGTLRDSFASNQ
ncbi:MAG: hypothetical protein REI78_01270 [Pedobacter sp.]|nr:hypothetical protein [Pedobacter sp.]